MARSSLRGSDGLDPPDLAGADPTSGGSNAPCGDPIDIWRLDASRSSFCSTSHAPRSRLIALSSAKTPIPSFWH